MPARAVGRRREQRGAGKRQRRETGIASDAAPVDVGAPRRSRAMLHVRFLVRPTRDRIFRLDFAAECKSRSRSAVSCSVLRVRDHVHEHLWCRGALHLPFVSAYSHPQSQATEEKAENARLASFVGALALGDLVKSTLGPKGMNKILQSGSSGDINVTNDGATILKSIQLDNAAAKILVNISKVQDDEVGDGTTSVCVLAAELLREAEKLIAQKIHPQTIIEGYRIASAAALRALEKAAKDNRCAQA